MVHLVSSLRTPTAPHRTVPKQPQTTQPAVSPGAQETSFSSWFPGTITAGPLQPATPPPAAAPPAPTAESVFGPNPWVTNPTGIGPDGSAYSYNPYYFATPATAAKVAQMLGGTVVQNYSFTPNGGPFAQQQACTMVKLPDGRLVNPGLVASFYTHGYPQSYIDMMIAAEVRNA